MRFSKDLVQRAKESTNIVDYVGRFVELKRTGKNYKGLCPFHKKKRLLFVVSEENQYFKCFGCGKSGDIISFIMLRDNLSFSEAVGQLLDDLGISHEDSGGDFRDYKREKLLYRINKEAARFFYKSLFQYKNPLNYLKERGLGLAEVNKFFIGYADSSWDSLYNYFHSHGVKDEDLIELGLVGRSESGKIYDKYRDRIIFPILDKNRRFIGFGGRDISFKSKAKYINSKESLIYHKGSSLYAIDKIYKSNNREKILLVEGYIDVISLHSMGIDYAIAALGTALTNSQAKLIKRLAKEIYICYDDDNAGQNAALKAIDVFKEISISPKIVTLEGGLDPDEYVKEYGKEGFELRLENAIDSKDFLLNNILKNFDSKDDRKLREVLFKLKDFLNFLPSEIQRDDYLRIISEKTGIDENSLRKDINAIKDIKKDLNSKEDNLDILKKDLDEYFKTALYFSIEDPKKLSEIYKMDYFISEYNLREILEKLLTLQDLPFNDKIEKLSSDIDDEEIKIFLRTLYEGYVRSNLFFEFSLRLKNLNLSLEKKKLQRDLSLIDSLDDKEDEKIEILRRIFEIDMILRKR